VELFIKLTPVVDVQLAVRRFHVLRVSPQSRRALLVRSSPAYPYPVPGFTIGRRRIGRKGRSDGRRLSHAGDGAGRRSRARRAASAAAPIAAASDAATFEVTVDALV
jgi:hypothetical protein